MQKFLTNTWPNFATLKFELNPSSDLGDDKETSTEVLRRSPQWALNTHTHTHTQTHTQKQREREKLTSRA